MTWHFWENDCLLYQHSINTTQDKIERIMAHVVDPNVIFDFIQGAVADVLPALLSELST